MIDCLPSYIDSVKGFIPPPSYQDVISSHQIPSQLVPNSFSHPDYYNVFNLEFKDADEIVDIEDEDVLLFLQSESDGVNAGFRNYQIRSNQEISDSKTSVSLLLRDKIIQINRNASFIMKKIRSRSNNYYINQLRNSAFKDFMRIHDRLQVELSAIDTLYQDFDTFNHQYEECSVEIKSLEVRLDDLFSHLNLVSTKSIISQISMQLYQQHNRLNKLLHNLHLIETKISRLSSTDDVSYVLKERARIYNDAKQIVRNQQNITHS